MRKLLTTAEVAQKIGYSTEWFYRNRAGLYKQGFPEPVLGSGLYGQARYDDRAIDLWLDSRMDPNLRDHKPHLQDAVRDIDKLIDTRLPALT